VWKIKNVFQRTFGEIKEGEGTEEMKNRIIKIKVTEAG